jgi:16S rRNA (guanine1207-N2)-methyltransferase
LSREAVYGTPPAALAASAPGAAQLSPLIPESDTLEALPDSSLDRIVILAPPGTLERRYVLAQGLRALKPEGEMIALAPKTKGGSRLADELAGFGAAPREDARRHHRICRLARPAHPVGLDAAIAAGAPRIAPGLGLWSQPGVFSWDRLDPGSALLLEHVDGLNGRGADLGCGVGVLSQRVLASPRVDELNLVDIDRRAIDAARKNIADRRARWLHLDARIGDPRLADLDFVVMNPPFHQGGDEDRGLGLAFISAAANMLRPGGVCRLVANIALPYAGRLSAAFSRVSILAQAGGYRVYEAVK